MEQGKSRIFCFAGSEKSREGLIQSIPRATRGTGTEMAQGTETPAIAERELPAQHLFR
jgi:hypothetical protein